MSEEADAKILIVDDEPHVRQFLRLSLKAEGFQVCEAATALEAIARVQADQPDLIILDLGLPDMDGHEVIREVRANLETPLLVLSGRAEDSDKIAAFERGADDYMTKPFAIRDLVTHARAALERERLKREQVAAEEVRTGRLCVRLATAEASCDGQILALEPEEGALLKALAEQRGRVLTVSRLQRVLWGREGDDDLDWSLQKLVGSLRRKIEEEPSFPVYVVTEPPVGYRLAILPESKGASGFSRVGVS